MKQSEGAYGAIGQIPDDWLRALGPAASPERLASIAEFVAQERRSTRVLPDPGLVFAALAATLSTRSVPSSWGRCSFPPPMKQARLSPRHRPNPSSGPALAPFGNRSWALERESGESHGAKQALGTLAPSLTLT
jgi:hypothetical protein